MPKPKKQDTFDDLTEIFATVPWWVPFALAVIAWFALPPLASAVGPDPGWRSLGIAARPLALVVLLGAAVHGQVERRTRARRRVAAGTLEGLRSMTWREFEQACAELFRSQSYGVEETSNGADGGVDLILRQEGRTVFVQCKHYKERMVGVQPVRELLGVVAKNGATAGIVVTTGTFTVEARAFARGTQIELIEGNDVVRLLGGPATTPRRDNARALATSEIPRVTHAPERHRDVPTRPANAYALWSAEEEQQLVVAFTAGGTIEAIARALGRQPGGIRARLRKLGLIEG